MDLEGAREHDPRSRRLLTLGGLVAVAALLAGLQWRALGSVEDTYQVAIAQLDQMREDIQVIRGLRQAPVTASSRARTNQELLAQVEQALSATGIDRAAWLDSVPQPPAQLPQSDYKRMTTRLYFEHLGLRQLTVFALELQRRDPTLMISAVNLSSREPESAAFDIELAVTYRVFAPQRTARDGERP